MHEPKLPQSCLTVTPEVTRVQCVAEVRFDVAIWRGMSPQVRHGDDTSSWMARRAPGTSVDRFAVRFHLI